MRGSVLLTIKESVMVNLDHMCLNNQSYYSLDVIEFQSELYDTQLPFTDTIGMNEKCRKMNLSQKASDFSYKTAFVSW